MQTNETLNRPAEEFVWDIVDYEMDLYKCNTNISPQDSDTTALQPTCDGLHDS